MNSMVRLTLLLFLFFLPACASTSQVENSKAASSSALAGGAGVMDPNRILAIIDGTPLRDQDLSPEVAYRLDEMENESLQRQFHLLWAGVEMAIAKYFLTNEAKARGISVEALREEEVDNHVTMPTEQEIRRFYDRQLAGSGVPFERAEGHIRAELIKERFAAAERSFVDKLRAKSDVRYMIPAPHLPRRPFNPGDGPALGPANAKVVLVVFSDFQCPYCARAGQLIHELHELYPKDLRIAFRDMPLEQHPQARGAAESAHCADEQHRFWEYHDLLFQNQNAQSAEDLLQYAAQVKLNMDQFQACLDSNQPKEAVRSSLNLAKKVGVESTPALYVNGIKLIGLLPLPLLQALIDKELEY